MFEHTSQLTNVPFVHDRFLPRSSVYVWIAHRSQNTNALRRLHRLRRRLLYQLIFCSLLLVPSCLFLLLLACMHSRRVWTRSVLLPHPIRCSWFHLSNDRIRQISPPFDTYELILFSKHLCKFSFNLRSCFYSKHLNKATLSFSRPLSTAVICRSCRSLQPLSHLSPSAGIFNFDLFIAQLLQNCLRRFTHFVEIVFVHAFPDRCDGPLCRQSCINRSANRWAPAGTIVIRRVCHLRVFFSHLLRPHRRRLLHLCHHLLLLHRHLHQPQLIRILLRLRSPIRRVPPSTNRTHTVCHRTPILLSSPRPIYRRLSYPTNRPARIRSW